MIKAKITYKNGEVTEDSILSHEIIGNLIKEKTNMGNEFYEEPTTNSKKEQAIIHDSMTMDVEELAEKYGMDEDDIRVILGGI